MTLLWCLLVLATLAMAVFSLIGVRFTVAMKNVYFRPVFDAVEKQIGDPYMIALDCVAKLTQELTSSIVRLAAAMVVLAVLMYIRPRPFRSTDNLGVAPE